MTRSEFISFLKTALKDKQISDYEEIIEEYEQHFTFKFRDGYSEDEIAAKLGDPTIIAEQFDKNEIKPKIKHKIQSLIGLGVLDFFSFIFYTVLICFGIGIAAFISSSLVCAVCLIGQANIYNLIPNMPYHIAIVFGATLIALSVIIIVSFIYYIVLLKQLYRSYKRFHCNTVSAANGKATLPSIPAIPQLAPKKHCILQKILTISFLTFVFLFAVSFVVAAVTAGNFEFWHIWEWFGYEK